jgi:transcriptional regulator with XRE-family HTH domain
MRRRTMTRDAFGPNLRRIRLQRGISMEQIAEITNIAQDLLEGLERNDFEQWPTGIFARAYVRQYAYAIGVDPDGAVDEFCRWFSQGDRRAEPTMREHADIVGHDLAWRDDATQGRRADDGAPALGEFSGATGAPPVSFLARLRRMIFAFR